MSPNDLADGLPASRTQDTWCASITQTSGHGTKPRHRNTTNWRTRMKYKVTVVFSYFDVIDVEADNKEDAMDIAWDLFDEKRMVKGDGEVLSATEIQGDETC